MKKFKLFALALFAMLSTNVFAADVYDANTVFRFKIIDAYDADKGTPGTAEITGFVADYTDFATTTIPAIVNGATSGGKYKVIAISKSAFLNKAITKLDLSKAENLATIGDLAFKGTGITSLDLTATKITTANQWFETTNSKVKTIKLPSSVDAIGESAFEGLSALKTLTIAAKTAPAKHELTIDANAFKNTMALKTLTLPANVKSIAASAFEKTYLTTLTITGDIPAKGVAKGAFVKNGSQALTVNYTPSTDGEDKTSFAQDAFAAKDAAVWVTFTTTTHYGETTLAKGLEADAKGNVLYGAKLDFTPTSLKKIKVYNQGTTYSYGAFTVPTGGIVIAKKQGDANVMVYGAYVDNAKTPAILMDQLHLIKGEYQIPAGANIIVKSSGTADVEYVEKATGDSQNYDADKNPRNEIKAYDGSAGDETYAVNVTPSKGKYIIFLKPLDEAAFGWAEFADNRIVKKGQFYLEADVPAAASRVIWLDGSEEDQVTAIQNVKTAAKNNGAIFNLAGQKVNASYKGVVIKDGKKYIQK